MSRRLDHPLAPAILGLVTAAMAVAIYLGGTGDFSRLVRASPPHADPAALRPEITIQGKGYDGMFYYRLALDPLTDDLTAHGITLDMPAYRQQRILYPALAWVASLGDPARVPAALAVVNVAAVALLGLLGGGLARAVGRHALWGSLFVLYPGVPVTLRSDLTEIVGAVFALGGLLLLRSAWTARASAAFALAALARETTLLVPAAVVATRLLRGPRASGAWLPLVAPAAVALAWQLSMIARWRSLPAAEGSASFDPPFLGLFAAAWLNGERFAFPGTQAVAWLAVVLFVLGSAFLGARALRATRALPHERSAWYAYAALGTVLEANIWANEAPLRTLTELGLLTALLVLAAPGRLRWWLLGMQVVTYGVVLAVDGHVV